MITKNIETTEANYDDAVKILTDRHHSERIHANFSKQKPVQCKNMHSVTYLISLSFHNSACRASFEVSLLKLKNLFTLRHIYSYRSFVNKNWEDNQLCQLSQFCLFSKQKILKYFNGAQHHFGGHREA